LKQSAALNWHESWQKVAVGSQNPVKLTAVSLALRQLTHQPINVQGVDVPTGVSTMPRSLDECVAGAQHRAIAAREAIDAPLGLGLEGGVEPTAYGLFLVGWVAAVDAHGRVHLGSSGRIQLPEPIAQPVLDGAELGPVMDALVGRDKTNHQEGAIGILTGGLVVREQMFTTAVLLALAPFLTPYWH
jgi:inosine/xanthosine triphosphatase